MSVRMSPTVVLTAAAYDASVAHITADGLSHSTVKENTVKSVHVGLDLLSAASEIDAALSGDTAKKFKPTRAIIRCTAQTGAAATGDSQIQIGTTIAGVDILAATVMTNLKTVGQCFIVNLTGLYPDIAGDATLHVKTAVKDTTGTTMLAEVTVEGTES